MSDRRPAWAHRLALAAAGATVVLIVAGGLVTNTGSALAVPDWPTTFGRNMFLYPLTGLTGGVLYEHSHRLLGALVGLLTVALGTALWWGDARRWVRALGAAAVGLVVIQGLVGGLRVVLLRDGLAIVHGATAQLFFSLLVVLAVVTAPGWHRARAVPVGRLPWLGLAMTLAIYGQAVLGALATHAGWVAPHLVGAAPVLVAASILAGTVLGDQAVRPALGPPVRVLAALLVGQVVLGLGAYAARFTALVVPAGQIGGLAFAVAHRVTGALLLGAAVALTLALFRLRAAGPAVEAVPGPALGIASRRVSA